MRPRHPFFYLAKGAASGHIRDGPAVRSQRLRDERIRASTRREDPRSPQWNRDCILAVERHVERHGRKNGSAPGRRPHHSPGRLFLTGRVISAPLFCSD